MVHSAALDRLRKITAAWEQHVCRLLKEEGWLAVGIVTHLPGVLGVVAANKINATNGIALHGAFHFYRGDALERNNVVDDFSILI